jgi:DNA-damage-inducible protein J
MAATTMLHVRIDDATKKDAAAVLASFGLSTSDAVRMFLHRVVAEKAFPLDLKVPNAETLAAMAEGDEIFAQRRARFANADELFAHLDNGER